MYAERIKQLAPNHDAKQIEAFMRLESGTLDGLTHERFAAEVVMAVMCIEEDPAMAEKLAATY